MLKIKLGYRVGEHRRYTTFEVSNDIDLLSFGLSIKESGTVESPYILTLSYDVKGSYPKISIYDSDSYVQVKDSNYYGIVVNKSKNVSLFDSKSRNLWIQNAFNVRIKDMIVKGKAVLWKCENVNLDNSRNFAPPTPVSCYNAPRTPPWEGF